MKKTFLLVFFFAFTNALIAQIKEGQLINQSSINVYWNQPIDFDTIQNFSRTRIKVKNVISKFESDKVSIGLHTSYALSNSKSPNNNFKSNVHTIKVGASYMRYFQIKPNFYFTFNPEVLLFTTMEFRRSDFFENTEFNQGIQVQVLPGLNYFFLPNWSFHLSCGFLSYTWNKNNSLNSIQHKTTANFSLASFQFGLAYMFEKRRETE